MARIPFGNFTFSKLWLNCHPKVRDLTGEHQSLGLAADLFQKSSINQPCFRTGRTNCEASSWRHTDTGSSWSVDVSQCQLPQLRLKFTVAISCKFKPHTHTRYIMGQKMRWPPTIFSDPKCGLWIHAFGSAPSQGVRPAGFQTVQLGLASGTFQRNLGHNR